MNPTETSTLSFSQIPPSSTPSPAATETALPATAAENEVEAAPEIVVITATPGPADGDTINGLIVVAMSDSGYTHLFAYQPETLPFTRLTTGDWDDMHPALSPDGKRVAYTSKRSGQWDIYTLDLTTGETIQLTDDQNYDSAPSWSNDGVWLAYEKYVDDNLEIFITTTDGTDAEIRLTFDPAADFSPAWSPAGRKIAFTSNRVGENDIWLADLDRYLQDGYLTNLTVDLNNSQAYPAWSPDASQLAWVAAPNGVSQIFSAQMDSSDIVAHALGSGDYAVWSPDGNKVLTSQSSANSIYLTAFSSQNQTIVLPPLELPRRVAGFSWGRNALPSTLPESLQAIAEATPESTSGQTPNAHTSLGRQALIELADVEARHPQLSALAIEPFYALRDRLKDEIGWDALASLEDAYVPFTKKLPPGLGNDWLYTGRAFTINSTYLSVDFMKIVKEVISGQTYWRVYLRTRFQDGSQGQPLRDTPWNFNARFEGNPEYYEQGGAPADTIPSGYWLDFTALAAEYGWERLPALTNWASFYQGARFNEFVYSSGLDWETAMLQLYPPEILITPTAVTP